MLTVDVVEINVIIIVIYPGVPAHPRSRVPVPAVRFCVSSCSCVPTSKRGRLTTTTVSADV